MRVAILGAGAIAYGGAAFLCNEGHDPVLWSPSGKRTAELAGGSQLIATGALQGRFRPRVAITCKEAIRDADVVMIALPANGHRRVFEEAAPHLADGQIVLISSHCSFGALYLAKLLAARRVHVPIVAWSTTVTTGRQKNGTEVHVGNVRKKVDVSVLPVSAMAKGLQVCRALFGDRFNERPDMLAISLSNLNPQNHMGIALCNLTRMELGEAWSQSGNTTDAVGRLLEALDAERLSVAQAFGHTVRTIKDHFVLSFNTTPGPVGEMARQMVARGDGTTGPTTLDTRYVTEDVPFGLLPTVLLGQLVGKPATLHDAGVKIFSALYGRDFAAENDLLPELKLESMKVADLIELCRMGWPAER